MRMPTARVCLTVEAPPRSSDDLVRLVHEEYLVFSLILLADNKDLRIGHHGASLSSELTGILQKTGMLRRTRKPPFTSIRVGVHRTSHAPAIKPPSRLIDHNTNAPEGEVHVPRATCCVNRLSWEVARRRRFA